MVSGCSLVSPSNVTLVDDWVVSPDGDSLDSAFVGYSDGVSVGSSEGATVGDLLGANEVAILDGFVLGFEDRGLGSSLGI